MHLTAATIFRFPTSMAPTFGEGLEDFLKEVRLKPVGPLELASIGFVSPFGSEDEMSLHHRIDDVLWLCVGTETRNLPAEVVNKELSTRLKAIEKAEGRTPGGRVRKRLKEEVIHDLLPKSFVKSGRTDVLIDLGKGVCAVNTTSRKAAENAVACIRYALGSFPAIPINAEIAPRSVLTGWISGNPLPDGVTLGEECELKDPVEKGAVVRCQRHELISDEISKHVEGGKQVTKLAQVLEDHVSYVIGEDLVLRKIKLLDAAVEQLESTEREDLRAELDARFALMKGEFARLFTMMESAFKLSALESA